MEAPVQLEKPGTLADLRDFRPQADWVRDTEVKTDIRYEQARWVVYLIFISIHHPLLLLRKRINSLRSQREARIYAEMYRRTASRDERGYLKSDQTQFPICDN